MLPFTGDRSWGMPAEGHTYPRGQMPEGFVRIVHTDYFRTMGIGLLEGRDFNAGDSPDSPPVVVINQTMARKLWPDRAAMGQHLQQGKDPLTVVGIVSDVRHGTLESTMTGEVYFPMRQRLGFSRVDLVVRSTLPMPQLTTAARAALEPIAPQASKGQWTTMQDLIDSVASPRRFVVMLLGGFATFAVLLAAIGIYALISFGVTQRRQEIGIRLALGAAASDVRRSVMQGTWRLALIGAVLGMLGAMLLVPAMGSMLFGVAWNDPASFVAALVILLITASVAGLFPAYRASRVDPSIALRDA
jgi:predicted permease